MLLGNCRRSPFHDISVCFVDRVPLYTAQVSLVLDGNKSVTVALSSDVFNISENPHDSETELIKSVPKGTVIIVKW